MNKHDWDFHGCFLEMRRNEELNEKLKQMRHVAWFLKRFPDTEEKAICEKYPSFDGNAINVGIKSKNIMITIYTMIEFTDFMNANK